MARWLSFFAEYNFRVEYKPGKLNVLANALSRRPNYKLAHVSRVTTDLYDRIRLAYQGDENYTPLVQFLSDGKDAKRVPSGPRLGSTIEPSCASGLLEVDESRLRLWPAGRGHGNTGILAFVCRLSKMVHFDPVRDKITGKQAAQLFLDSVFRYHGLPETIVSDRDPRFTGAFWDTLFQLLGTKLTMSTADHPQMNGQTERVNHVLEDTLRSICAVAPRSRSDQLPMVEFALNNAVHASTGFTPF
ncbi:Polyprotein [Phytophthora palmivora]|uniref:Polyprotein n=1 Tax=Phytophthora palmivora TaxID=4796 RepID=A0A2P4YB49_9STRA|nr:Polyprotein [Phytophthora palmivora]